MFMGLDLKQFATLKFWKEMLIVTIGMFFTAAAVNYFLVPSKLVIGSTAGLAIILNSLLAGIGVQIKVSTLVLIINTILVILGIVLIGSEFGIKTAYASLVIGPMMELWQRICPYESLMAEGDTSVMGDIWFDLVCFVFIISVSQAILFRINASTGGLDILAKIVNVYSHLDIGTSVTVAGVIICATAFFVNPFKVVIVGLIGTWLNGVVLDYFTSRLNARKRVCIVTDESDKVREYIVTNINRTCSLYEAIGGFTGEKRIEIQAILTRDEYASLLEYIRDNKIPAFITAGNVSEVYGNWSKHRKTKK